MNYDFTRIQISCGSTGLWTELGYKLSNGAILLDSEQDGEGRYRGGVGMDGAYLRTNATYSPIYNRQNELVAFQKIKSQ